MDLEVLEDLGGHGPLTGLPLVERGDVELAAVEVREILLDEGAVCKAARPRPQGCASGSRGEPS